MIERIWNKESDDFTLGRQVPLPKGYISKKCPNCGSSSITGAIICYSNGEPVISSSDDNDPNLICLNCGYWADEFP